MYDGLQLKPLSCCWHLFCHRHMTPKLSFAVSSGVCGERERELELENYKNWSLGSVKSLTTSPCLATDE